MAKLTLIHGTGGARKSQTTHATWSAAAAEVFIRRAAGLGFDVQDMPEIETTAHTRVARITGPDYYGFVEIYTDGTASVRLGDHLI